MLNTIDLKQIERKAYRSTFEDGLMDMLLGAIIAFHRDLYVPSRQRILTDQHHRNGVDLCSFAASLPGREEIHHPAAHGAGALWTRPQAKAEDHGSHPWGDCFIPG